MSARLSEYCTKNEFFLRVGKYSPLVRVHITTVRNREMDLGNGGS